MSQHVSMTVHEALVEIKNNVKRIDDSIMNGIFCVANKQSSKKINGIDIDSFNKEISSNYNSIIDLIKRTDAIKKAISLSNASTYITVADNKMTVAEALYALSHGCDDKQNLIDIMVTQLQKATVKIDFENGEKLDNKVEAFINASYGSKDKVDANDIASLTETFRNNNSYVLIDPINIRDQIKKLQDEVDKFKNNVDSALQISNATTVIEFDY